MGRCVALASLLPLLLQKCGTKVSRGHLLWLTQLHGSEPAQRQNVQGGWEGFL